MDEQQALAHVRRRLGARPRSAERLSGGLLNDVFRVTLAPGEGSVIVKHAPPHVAAAPEIALSSERLRFEARAIGALSPGGRLARCATDEARPPRLLDEDPAQPVLIMEDVGPLPDLLASPGGGVPVAAVGERLGRFVGRLHRETEGDGWVAKNLHNADVQSTRHVVQYAPVAAVLSASGVESWESDRLGARAVALGERLQEPGRCLIMGDLWPASVLLLGGGRRLRVIDWEFAHCGRPCQDVGHLAAHLWLAARRRGEGWPRRLWSGFVRGYVAEGLSVVVEDCVTHGCAEVLVRTAGAFSGGAAAGVRAAGLSVSVAGLRGTAGGLRDWFGGLRGGV